MKNLDKIIAESEKSLKQLNEKMHEFDEIVNILRKLKEAPEEMQILLEEVLLKAKSYTEDINKITNNYLLASNETIFNNLNELSLCNKNLQTEIDRLIGTDFSVMFKSLEQDFVNTVSHQFEIELAKVFEITDVFQSKIDLLQTEISRLEEVDIEKGFDELQDSLAKMFKAIISINQTLLDLGSNFSKMFAKLDAQNQKFQALEESLNETKKDNAKGFSTTIEHVLKNNKQITELQSETTNNSKNIEALLMQFKEQQNLLSKLEAQNVNILKQAKLQKILIISGFSLAGLFLVIASIAIYVMKF